ncbi:MAG: Asp-tRNA(Asn)/Glu-tRNA(Gln) amidotransferase subunit GatA [Clostridia bacterium]|nr:Asp-tRNA(Asn)/Glu-tRNA(Gln) amidotransferase subunit GatA [Clostridia bacterium]
MELYQLTAHQLHELLAKKEISVVDIVSSFRDRIETTEAELGSFLLFRGEEAFEQAKELDKAIAGGKELTPLTGIPVGVKDNICTKGIKTTCASKMLADFVPTYDATVVEKLAAQDSIMMGKLNMDEFAFGSTGELSAVKPTKNPWDLERVPGGSSSGSAAAVASGQLPLALGSDTGGSVRQPAALCGLVGLKPTYGLVSRSGLVPTVGSMETVGPLARDVRDCVLLLQAIAGHDPKDSTSSTLPVPDYGQSLSEDVKGLKVGVPKEYFGEGLEPEVTVLIKNVLKLLEEGGAHVEEISMPHTECALAAYYMIGTTEVSSNLARMDGVRFGYRNLGAEDLETMYVRSRGEGLGSAVIIRTLLGHFFSGPGRFQDYYVKGLKLRTLVKQDFDAALANYDLLITPTSPKKAWPLNDQEVEGLQAYRSDICTIPANLAGVPALSLPCGLAGGLPVGVQLIGRPFDEPTIFRAAYALERQLNFPKDRPLAEVK